MREEEFLFFNGSNSDYLQSFYKVNVWADKDEVRRII